MGKYGIKKQCIYKKLFIDNFITKNIQKYKKDVLMAREFSWISERVEISSTARMLYLTKVFYLVRVLTIYSTRITWNVWKEL